MWRTGHSLIKAKMAETGAPLAGEMSGHIFFADRYYGFDDALYAAVRLLDIVSRATQSLAADARRAAAGGQHAGAALPLQRGAQVRRGRGDGRGGCARPARRSTTSTACGCSTADGWWLLRASNTQDVLVARCESQTAEGLERLKAAVVGRAHRQRDRGAEVLRRTAMPLRRRRYPSSSWPVEAGHPRRAALLLDDELDRCVVSATATFD